MIRLERLSAARPHRQLSVFNGFVLPENAITIAIATDAVRVGELTIKVYRAESISLMLHTAIALM